MPVTNHRLPNPLRSSSAPRRRRPGLSGVGRGRLGGLALVAGLVWGGTGSVAGAAESPDERRLDPRLRVGPTAAPADARLSALVKLPGLTEAGRAELERRGLVFRRAPDGTVRRLANLYPVDGPQSVLSTLAREGSWVHVGSTRRVRSTLRSTGDEVEAFDLWGVGPTPSQSPAGYPFRIGLVDSGIDVYHPHMFRADGGAWPWVDVDGDGEFTLGIDGVDLDSDGSISDDERLLLMDYQYLLRGPAAVEDRDDELHVAWDYLYLDANDNGRRDWGPDAGYGEDSPGYGELMYLPDDANGDGRLSPTERLWLLDTSIVNAVWVEGLVWTRGVDLLEAPEEVLTASHGTLTGGIMTGGQRHPFRSNRGLLPNAEISVVALGTLADISGEQLDMVDLATGLAWLTQDMDVDVANHSWGQAGDHVHRDGSDMFDAAIDALSAEGVVQACAAGNRRDDRLHSLVTSDGGEAGFEVSVPLRVAAVEMSSFNFDLYWSETSLEVTCTLRDPDGEEHEVEETPDGDFLGRHIGAFRSDSERGVAMLAIDIGEPSESTAVGEGSWMITCRHDGADPVDFHGYLTSDDDVSSGTLHFPESSASHTIVSPALSDSCLAMGGYQSQFDYPLGPGSKVGEMAYYSSEGPRIDGARSVDVIAPVDPVAPSTGLGVERNGYGVGSGTSSASPHGAAIAALIKAADPSLSPAEIRARIIAAAEPTTDGPLPDPHQGFGELRGYRALTGLDPEPRPERVEIGVEVEFEATARGCRATAVVTDSDWDDASFRFDLDYDGRWDIEFGAERSASWAVPADAGSVVIRVDAAQRGWIVAGLAREIEVPPACIAMGTGSEGSDGEGSDGSQTGSSTTMGTRGDESGSPPEQSGDDGGCGCRSSGPRVSGAWLVPWVLGLRRRRRR